MFKCALSFTFALGLVFAATINTSVTCDGVTTMGFCDDGHFMAHAGLTAPAFVDSQISPGLGAFGVSVDAGASGGLPPLGSSSALANFDEDYLFTVLGGTGNGFFFPCFLGTPDAGSSVSMSFGGIGLGIVDNPSGIATNCPGPGPFPGSIPFTFGVPQIVDIAMTGSAGASTFFPREVDARESFDPDRGILFFDPSGNQLSNVAFTLVEVPEPTAWSLLGIGLLCLLVVPILGMPVVDASADAPMSHRRSSRSTLTGISGINLSVIS
jgi:hypothetical protein